MAEDKKADAPKDVKSDVAPTVGRADVAKAEAAPTVGRVVHVEVGAAWWPAIVTEVHDATTVSAVVFGAHGAPATLAAKLTSEHWRWPARS